MNKDRNKPFKRGYSGLKRRSAAARTAAVHMTRVKEDNENIIVSI